MRCPDGLIARNNQRKPLGHIGLVLRRTGQDQQASVGKCREVSNPSPWVNGSRTTRLGGATPVPGAKRSAGTGANNERMPIQRWRSRPEQQLVAIA